MPRLFRFCCLAALFALSAPTLRAQQGVLTPRFGIALNGLLSFDDGLGIGALGRASAPINADLSAAVDLGVTGFILEGRTNATYVVTPGISLIVNLPDYRNKLTYLVAGFGAYLPVNRDDNSDGGPTFNIGLGQVMGLRETSLFYEVMPSLIVGEKNVKPTLAGRIGVIF